MKIDGSITYYTLEQKIENDNGTRWSDCEDLRMFNDTLDFHDRQEFTDLGECWQKYGYHGTLRLELAQQIINTLEKNIIGNAHKHTVFKRGRHPSDKYPCGKIIGFRIIKHVKTQETSVLDF